MHTFPAEAEQGGSASQRVETGGQGTVAQETSALGLQGQVESTRMGLLLDLRLSM